MGLILEAILFVAIAVVVYGVVSKAVAINRLKHLPGPVVCRLSNIFRAGWVWRGVSHLKHSALHEDYGDVVVLGPSMVAVSDPDAISIIYPIRPGFPKGDFYATLMPYNPSGSVLPLVFNTRDEELHGRLKSPVAPIFSLSNVLKFEKHVDQVTNILLRQLDDRFVATGVVCNLGDWLKFYAFEVMAMMTFSNCYGFLENGEDNNGLTPAIWRFMKTAAPIPWLDKVLYKNRVAAWWRKGTTGMPILNLALDSIEARTDRATENSQSVKASDKGDMLDHFLSVQRSNPAVPDWAPVAWTFSNLIAGSDSTAAVLQTLWYNLLMSPGSVKKIQDELVEAGLRSVAITPWNQASQLCFLDACVNEAIRLHPPFCLPFERIVPAEGIFVCGKFLPGGTTVGMDPWVVNRDKATFGLDADDWRPERWLCPPQERKGMDRAVLTFGAGRRACLGRQVAMVEIKKLTCALLLNYEMDIVNPGDFKTENRWFFRQTGLNARIRRRQSTEEDHEMRV